MKTIAILIKSNLLVKHNGTDRRLKLFNRNMEVKEGNVRDHGTSSSRLKVSSVGELIISIESLFHETQDEHN